MPRFILLEHTAAPDDPAGLHYDLLLEEGPQCRTWRLAGIPEPGGPGIVAVELPAHRLAWLEHDAGEVAGGRGFARRIDAGTYAVRPPGRPADAGVVVDVTLQGARVGGRLVLRAHDGRGLARLVADHPGAEAGES